MTDEDEPDAVDAQAAQIAALAIIASRGCSRSTSSDLIPCYKDGYSAFARYTAYRACSACIARRVLVGGAP